MQHVAWDAAPVVGYLGDGSSEVVRSRREGKMVMYAVTEPGRILLGAVAGNHAGVVA